MVKNRLPPSGSKNPIKEKQAGQTPSMNPSDVPPIPVFTSFLQLMHLFLAYKYSTINIPNKPENTT
ncbi:MAG: hypothetical protein HZA82_01705 [Thaumarchaeota archaeon]|nr:hypothetical protein [Nitrososphaerota archaeon]